MTVPQGFLKTIKSYLNRNRLGELMVTRNHLTPEELKSACPAFSAAESLRT